MKKAILIILTLGLMWCLFACSSNNKPTGLLADEEFVECMKNTFAEIDINIDPKNCTIIEDNQLQSDYRSVTVQAIYNDVEMKYNCFYTSKCWTSVYISNLNSDMFYWIRENNKNDYDLYDWKTGEIIPNSTTNNDSELFRHTIKYDDYNYCQLILSYSNEELSIIGVCVFDGTDLRNETLRSLAFTVYCLENANTFCEGNFIMTYKSGELTGFANYTNGECTLSDFPDVWNKYASEITQTEIEAEIQNVIDNIK